MIVLLCEAPIIFLIGGGSRRSFCSAIAGDGISARANLYNARFARNRARGRCFRSSSPRTQCSRFKHDKGAVSRRRIPRGDPVEN